MGKIIKNINANGSSVWQVSHARTYQISTNFNGLFAIHSVSISALISKI